MVRLLKANYDSPACDFSKVPGNKVMVDTETDYSEIKDGVKLARTLQIEEVIKGQDFDKLVYGCRANNELLPFPDASFDAYVAGMSLMLVPNHRN